MGQIWLWRPGIDGALGLTKSAVCGASLAVAARGTMSAQPCALVPGPDQVSETVPMHRRQRAETVQRMLRVAHRAECTEVLEAVSQHSRRLGFVL